jgi:actin
MSLYAAGRTTGLVIDAGHGVCQFFPVFEGFTISHAINKSYISGCMLTNYLQKLLLEIDESFASSYYLKIVSDIKEKLCYVAQNYEEEERYSYEMDRQYTLPDRRVINVSGYVRMTCPELLFKPNLDGITCTPIHQLTSKSIQESDIDIRKDLCKNIILSGGTTMYEGFADRFKKEIIALDPTGRGYEIRVHASNDHIFAVWNGASTLSSLSTFELSWMTKEDYQEHGAAIIHRKCA